MHPGVRAGTVGAVAALTLALGTAGASAHAISGGGYSGAAVNDTWFALDQGAYNFTCAANVVTVSGDADGTGTTTFTPDFGGVGDCYFVVPTTVTQSGAWDLTVTSGPHAGGWYHGTVDVPTATTTAIYVPLLSCTATMTGSQSFTHGSGGSVVRVRNVVPTGAEVELAFNDFDYTAAGGGCPYSSGNDGWYTTDGPIVIPGVTVS